MLKNNFFLLCIFFLSTATLSASSNPDSLSDSEGPTNSTLTVDAKKPSKQQPSNRGRTIFFPKNNPSRDSADERRPAQTFKNLFYIPPISRKFFIRNETTNACKLRLIATGFNEEISLKPNQTVIRELSLTPEALVSTIYNGQREDRMVYKRGDDVTIAIQPTNVVHFEQAKINREEILKEIAALHAALLNAKLAALREAKLARENPQR